MSLYDTKLAALDGTPDVLAGEKGKVTLMVNVASFCGLTPQYEGLQQLYDTYAGRGLTVLGFPCDQFGHQEPGTEDEIATFCERNYGVTFPMFAKIDVNGSDTHPLYKYLKHEAKGLLGSEAIKWNFTKFLVGKDGEVVKRYAPTDTPQGIEKEVAAAL